MARKLRFLERGARLTVVFSGKLVGILEGGFGPVVENGGLLDIRLKDCACADFFKFLSVLAGPVGSLFSSELARNIGVTQCCVMTAMLSCIDEAGVLSEEPLSIIALRSYRQALSRSPLEKELVGAYEGAPKKSLEDFLKFVTTNVASGILDRFCLCLAREMGVEALQVRRAFNILCWDYGVKSVPNPD